TMHMDSIRRAMDSTLGTLEDFEQWLAPWIHKTRVQDSIRRLNKSAPTLYNIPCVFHVVYANSSQNISDAQILSQIEVLNEDFKRLNADTVNTLAEFRPVAASVEVNFCLAQQDPDGNPSSGITRHNISGGPWTSSAFDAQVKPQTIWNPNEYLNIWVANLDGLLGYAQFPSNSGLPGLPANGGGAATDGIVLHYTSVGRPPANPFVTNNNLGRTATHEVGHYLGLRHIWGDGGCSASDYCNDTPEAEQANYGCQLNRVSCGSLDMVQNYMDYSRDNCMNLFTRDQRTRMITVMQVALRRASLNNSPRCNPPVSTPSAAFDLVPARACVGTPVRLRDRSSRNPTGWQWTFVGANIEQSNVQNPTVVYYAPGTYPITLVVSNAFGSDTLTQNVVVVEGALPPPFTETFENGAPGWTTENPDGGVTWTIATVGGTTPGNRAAKMDFYNYNSVGQRDGLISPPLDLRTVSTCTLSFQHAYRRYSASTTDSLIVYASSDCGATWTRLFARGENGQGSFATQTISTNVFTPTQSSQWCGGGTGSGCFSINLNAFVGQPRVRLKFEAYNNYGNNLYLDNINVTGTPASASVWPGDTDDNGVVNAGDVYLAASAHGATGPTRSQTGTLWQAYPAPALWNRDFIVQNRFVNARTADANGDGSVNLFDVAIAVLHRGLSR
ncbi:MAG: M43 family zinc metalloprotease, partial [Bacteroidia bacterium]|nr:M43 family zinc metalloprotease [Bacteroidia bacterium]